MILKCLSESTAENSKLIKIQKAVPIKRTRHSPFIDINVMDLLNIQNKILINSGILRDKTINNKSNNLNDDNQNYPSVD